MPAAPLVVALIVTGASLVGVAVLAVATAPLRGDAAALFSAGAILLTLVAVSGILLARSRWAPRLAVGIAATWVVVGSILETPWGMLVSAAGAAGIGALTGPWLDRWLRRLPRADGVPPAAVVALLTLVGTPATVGLAATSGVHPAGWGLAAWSVALALLLGRGVPGSLAAARLIHPLATVGTGIAAGLPTAIPMVLSGVLVSAACWRREVGLAVAPIVPVVASAFRLPPELAPEEVLSAAGADRSGRRRP